MHLLDFEVARRHQEDLLRESRLRHDRRRTGTDRRFRRATARQLHRLGHVLDPTS